MSQKSVQYYNKRHSTAETYTGSACNAGTEHKVEVRFLINKYEQLFDNSVRNTGSKYINDKNAKIKQRHSAMFFDHDLKKKGKCNTKLDLLSQFSEIESVRQSNVDKNKRYVSNNTAARNVPVKCADPKSENLFAKSADEDAMRKKVQITPAASKRNEFSHSSLSKNFFRSKSSTSIKEKQAKAKVQSSSFTEYDVKDSKNKYDVNSIGSNLVQSRIKQFQRRSESSDDGIPQKAQNNGAIPKQSSDSQTVTYRKRTNSYVMAMQDEDFRKFKIFPDSAASFLKPSDTLNSYVSKTVAGFENADTNNNSVLSITDKQKYKNDMKKSINNVMYEYSKHRKAGTLSKKENVHKLRLEIDNVLLTNYKKIADDTKTENVTASRRQLTPDNKEKLLPFILTKPKIRKDNESSDLCKQNSQNVLTDDIVSENQNLEVNDSQIFSSASREKMKPKIPKKYSLSKKTSGAVKNNQDASNICTPTEMLPTTNLQGVEMTNLATLTRSDNQPGENITNLFPNEVDNYVATSARNKKSTNSFSSEDNNIQLITVVYHQDDEVFDVESHNARAEQPEILCPTNVSKTSLQTPDYVIIMCDKTTINNTSSDDSVNEKPESARQTARKNDRPHFTAEENETSSRRRVSDIITEKEGLTFSYKTVEGSNDADAYVNLHKYLSDNTLLRSGNKEISSADKKYSVSSVIYTEEDKLSLNVPVKESDTSAKSGVINKRTDKVSSRVNVKRQSNVTTNITQITDISSSSSSTTNSSSSGHFSLQHDESAKELYNGSWYEENCFSTLEDLTPGDPGSIFEEAVKELESEQSGTIQNNTDLPMKTVHQDEGIDSQKPKRTSRLYSGRFGRNFSGIVSRSENENVDSEKEDVNNNTEKQQFSFELSSREDDKVLQNILDATSDANKASGYYEEIPDMKRKSENIDLEFCDQDSDGPGKFVEAYNAQLPKDYYTTEWVENVKSQLEISETKKSEVFFDEIQPGTETVNDDDDVFSSGSENEQVVNKNVTHTVNSEGLHSITYHDAENNPIIRFESMQDLSDFDVRTSKDKEIEDSEREFRKNICNIVSSTKYEKKIEKSEKEYSKNISYIPSYTKKQCLVRELVETEKYYVDVSLQRIVKDYMPEMDKPDLPGSLIGKTRNIFGNVDLIYDCHKKKFLPDLESCNSTEEIGRCFLKHEAVFKLYPLYAKNNPRSVMIMRDYGKYFVMKQTELQDRLDLASYLLTPIQRMTKYAMLIEHIIYECKKEKLKCEELCLAFDMVRYQLSQGNDLIAIDSIVKCTVNIKEQGDLLIRDTFTVISPNKKQPFVGMVFLFRESLLITSVYRENGMEYFIFHDNILLTELGYTEMVQEPNEFEVWFRKRDKERVYILRTKRPQSKKTWIKEIFGLLWKQLEASKKLRNKEMEKSGIKHTNVPVTPRPYSIPNSKGKHSPVSKELSSSSTWYS